jgi:NAD(P)-dependent dehydrogenase (short-subunit alcohol dehydrogenase family)
MNPFSLKDRVALITGGNGGIGLGMAEGLARDFAGIAVFLASAASDFITGAAIPVDGGYSIAA